MDNQINETSSLNAAGIEKEPPASITGGIEKGAGDSPTSSFIQNTVDKSSLASLNDRISQLQLPKSIHGKGESTGTDTLHDESSSDEDDEIEPLCSYPYGYIKRQTVYVCLTCNSPFKENWKPAGVCIGCRHACHQGHEVISMETRRNFRCDCGNKKFPEGSKCLLYSTKNDMNEMNIYNNNYKGTFCTCNCKEADCVEDDPLYQCVVCEDWYHASHCNCKTDGIEKNYTDLVCGTCTSKLDFLRYYEPFDPNTNVDEAAIEEMMKYTDDDSDDEEVKSLEDSKCKLEKLVKKEPYKSGHLWTLGWRGKLCKCAKCKEMYASLDVSFLIDKEDETRRYFDDEEDETQTKICEAIQKFEEWLLQMDPIERDEMFGAGPEVVKQKMKEHFAESSLDEASKPETSGEVNEFLADDQLLDQLLQAFTEFVLEAEGGTDYLLDVDALKSIMTSVGVADDQDAQGLVASAIVDSPKQEAVSLKERENEVNENENSKLAE